ncbi:MAG: hypothetical protein WC212_00465 [Candidatus Delongbacteria bacterium]|jgi:hypothetical protein
MAKNSIIDMLQNNNEKEISETHPAANLDIEGKNLYINVLGFFAGIEGKIPEKFEVFLKNTISQIGLQKSKILEITEMADNPNQEILSESIDYFINKSEKYHLVIDCLTMAEILNPIEQKFTDILMDKFRFDAEEKDFFQSIHSIIKTADVEKAFYKLVDNNILFEKFKQVLKTHSIDLEEFRKKLVSILDFETEDFLVNNIDETNKLYDKILGFEIQEGIKIKDYKGFKISKSYVTNRQFIEYLKYLNSKCKLQKIKTQIETSQDSSSSLQLLSTSRQKETNKDLIYLIDDIDNFHLCISNSAIKFDNDIFTTSKSNCNSPITGIDMKSAEKYCAFLSKVIGGNAIYRPKIEQRSKKENMNNNHISVIIEVMEFYVNQSKNKPDLSFKNDTSFKILIKEDKGK